MPLAARKSHMKTLSQALVLSTLGLAGLAAQASVITFETASSSAGAQASAADYRSVVNAALAQPGTKFADIALYDGISNASVFAGASSNIAFRSTIDFGVAANQAGTWSLRAGVDFGKGGAVFLDGVALGFKTNDMWWGGSYANPTQSFSFSNLNIAAGQHRLQIFGLEGCCDGGQQAQFSANGAGFQSFAKTDGLINAVPEPSSYALMLAGLAGMGWVARRRQIKR